MGRLQHRKQGRARPCLRNSWAFAGSTWHAVGRAIKQQRRRRQRQAGSAAAAATCQWRLGRRAWRGGPAPRRPSERKPFCSAVNGWAAGGGAGPCGQRMGAHVSRAVAAVTAGSSGGRCHLSGTGSAGRRPHAQRVRGCDEGHRNAVQAGKGGHALLVVVGASRPILDPRRAAAPAAARN